MDTDVGPVEPAEPPDFEAPPSQQAAEWEPVDAYWQIGLESQSGGFSAVGEELNWGRFRLPDGGGSFGVRWDPVAINEEGRPEGAPSAQFYVSATFDGNGDGVIVQADNAFNVYLDDRHQPGDIYGSGRNRMPFWTADGEEHDVVWQIEGRRGAGRTRLWTTPDEMAFVLSDVTAPHLIAGADTTQPLGVPIMNLTDEVLGPVRTRVVGSELFAETTDLIPGIAPGGVTQLPFHLQPTGTWPADVEEVEVTLRIEAANAEASYEITTTVPVAEWGTTYRRTFISGMDGSAQYYGVVVPDPFVDGESYGMVLSLHGASVQGLGQARAYSRRDWNFLIAPTNRRPFGFDWEVFGRVDAIESLEDAQAFFATDPTRVHVTGHSMGGHGTWQLGTLFPDRFATVGPSAGWSSFYSYTGYPRPSSIFARASASSDTNAYVSNLFERCVYVIHGDADDNVPVREARDMVALLEDDVEHLEYHEQPGAGHWWNVDPEPGADCVDWPAMFDMMEGETIDPHDLDFDFITPSPWVSPRYTYVTIRSLISPWEDGRLASSSDGSTVTLTTTNVRSLTLDGDILTAEGVDLVVVDGEEVEVTPGAIPLGPQDGKRPGVHGPFNEVMEQPFCYVVETDGYPIYRDLAAFLTSSWQVIGNGRACTVELDAVTPWIEQNYNLIYTGVWPDDIIWDTDLNVTLQGDSLVLGEGVYDNAALAMVHPSNGRLAGYLMASDFYEPLLFEVTPFSSRLVLPDFLIWGTDGAMAAGMFDGGWGLRADFGVGLP